MILYLRSPRHHSLAGHHHRYRLGMRGKSAADSAMEMNKRASQVPGNPVGNQERSGTVAKQGSTENKQGSTVAKPNSGTIIEGPKKK